MENELETNVMKDINKELMPYLKYILDNCFLIDFMYFLKIRNQSLNIQ